MMQTSARNCLGALAHDRRGAVGLYFAMVISVAALLAVAALDLIRVHLVRSHIAMAVDSAILAAGRSLGTDTWQQVGVAYYNANATSSLGVTLPTVAAKDFIKSTVGSGQATQRVTLSVNTSLPMWSKGLGNIGAMDVGVTAIAQWQAQTVDLAMVLDNTGSMLTNDNITKLGTAANTLVTTLANGQTTTLPFSRIAVVPYAVAVNVGIPPGGVAKTVADLQAGDYAGTVAQKLVPGTPFAPKDALGWHGCVLEDAALAIEPAATVAWRPYKWGKATDNEYTPGDASSVRSSLQYGNDGGGPNLGCPETPITPLTNNIGYLKTALSGMQAWHRGGTLSDVGMAWGARVLSPHPPFANGVAWGDRSVTRAIVLMTDGDANFNYLGSDLTYDKKNSAVFSDYGAYDRLSNTGPMKTTNSATARTWVENNLGALCTTLKAAPYNMRIFTVTFGNVATNTATVYRNCASTANDYFPTADGASLTKAFGQIGGSLNELVLVQ